MKFQNLSQYLLFKPACPFCYQDLGVEIFTAIQLSNFSISDSERLADGIHYIFTARVPPNQEHATDFKITLRMNGKISYTTINPVFYEKATQRKHFIEAFNNSHPQIVQSCINRSCLLNFIKQSLPLYLDEDGLNPLKLYCESFKFDNYTISNNYVDDVTEIYIGDEPTPPIKIKLYELTEKSTPLVFDRIKMSAVFS